MSVTNQTWTITSTPITSGIFKWIKWIKDSNPTDERLVLVTLKLDICGTVVHRSNVGRYCSGKWVVDGLITNEVVAWSDLPEPLNA